MRRIAAFLVVLALGTLVAVAQDADGDGDQGLLAGLIQNALSGPGREVRLSGIEGALSSRATIAEIAVADREGVWLRIENAVIDWNRTQLLRRRLDVESLAAERIDYIRPALPPERTGPALPRAEAEPFSLPELPVAVRLQDLEIGTLAFGEAVFGQAAELTASGSLELAGGVLDTELAVERLDAPGGRLALSAEFSNETRQLALDLALQEPEGGIVATLLNLEGRPAIELTLAGSGPLDELDVNFALDAGAERIAEGVVALRQQDAGLGFTADFQGGLAPLIPPEYRDFFAGTSEVHVAGVSKSAGGVRIDTLALQSAALDLDGSLETGPDNFPRDIDLTGSLGDPRGAAVLLPVPGGATRLNSATFHVTYGDGQRWSGLVALDRLAVGEIEIEDLTLTLGGLAENLDDPAQRNVTINVEGLATGVWAEDPELRAAIGSRIDLFADAAIPPDAPIAIRQLQVSGNGLSIFTAGMIEDLIYSGRSSIRAAEVATFSGLAGRDLEGALNLSAIGSVTLSSGGFDLMLDGTATDLAIDEPRVDRLLDGETALSGRVARDQRGLRTEDFRIANQQIEFSSDGRVTSLQTDISFEARLADLGLLAPQLSGALEARGRAQGLAGPIRVELEAAVPEGTVADRRLTNASVSFRGNVLKSNVTGRVAGDGALDGLEMRLTGDLGLVGTTRALRDLELAVGPNRITGTVVQQGDGPAEGRLEVDAPEVAPLAALALVEAQGAVQAVVELGPAEVGQGAQVSARIDGLEVAGSAIERLELEAQVVDALGVPLVNGTLDAEGISAAGIVAETLTARAEQLDGDRMAFVAETRLAIGTEAEVAGELARLEDGFAATLERLSLTQADIAARLTAPATVTFRGGTIELTPLGLDLGQGRLEAEGSIGENFDLSLLIRDLPLGLAATIQPGLGLEGVLNGTAEIGGPREAPDVTFQLSGADLSAAALQSAGLPPLAIEAEGRTEGERLAIDAAVTAPGGLAASAEGALPLGAEGGAIDLAVALDALPLALLDPLAGGRGLEGTLTGTAEVGGSYAAPEAGFDLAGSGLSARLLADNGVPPLNVTTTGGFADDVVSIASVAVTGGGISLTGSGQVPLAGPGLDASVAGSLPVGLANRALAEREAQASGTVQVDLSATGSLQEPSLAGSIGLAGGTLVDPRTNIRLEEIALDARLAGDAVTVASLTARAAAGGRISASGTVAVDPGQGFPADLAVQLSSLRYTDGTFVTTEISGELALTGPVVGGGTLAGRIALGTTEISVAEGFGVRAGVELEEVQHVRAPPDVERTLARARIGEEDGDGNGAEGPGLGLDIQISAPNQIFIRGRGLDAELGGELRVLGTTNDVQPVGQFELRRGRIAILGQRIEFDEGSLTLTGTLNPEVFLVASTESGGVTAFVTVSGRVTEPDISFSSNPDLPEDEVLARILFNRSAADLSAFQLAQLAAAAAELAGGGGNGLLSRLRTGAGLDDLDIITEEGGATAVRAGKYIEDNVYLDLQTNSEGTTSAAINLDITDQLTARGAVASDGNTSIGIFYERDY